MNMAVVLSRLDEHLNGAPFGGAMPEDLLTFVEALSRRQSPATVTHYVRYAKAYFRWLHDDELSKPLRRVLKRRRQDEMRDIEPVCQAEFRALPDEAHRLQGRARAVLAQAIQWVLWDTGFRVSEMLALRWCDFKANGRGCARLRLPRVGAAIGDGGETLTDLKTGTRDVYVVDCIPVLWLWKK